MRIHFGEPERNASRGLDLDSHLSAGLMFLFLSWKKRTLQNVKVSRHKFKGYITVHSKSDITLRVKVAIVSPERSPDVHPTVCIGQIKSYGCITVFLFISVCFQPKLKSYHAKSVETSHQASTMESSHVKAVRSVKDVPFIQCNCKSSSRCSSHSWTLEQK